MRDKKIYAADTRIAFMLIFSFFFFDVFLCIVYVLRTRYRICEALYAELSEHIDRFGLYGFDEEDIHPHVIAIYVTHIVTVYAPMIWCSLHEDLLLIARFVAIVEWPITVR